jgi:hypothetical protein
MTRIPIDLIKANLFGIGSRRVERDGTGDERKAQEALTRWLAKQAGFSDEQARWIADGWVSIRPKSGQKIVDAPDFRDELQMKKYPAGIVLDVNVSGQHERSEGARMVKDRRNHIEGKHRLLWM